MSKEQQTTAIATVKDKDLEQLKTLETQVEKLGIGEVSSGFEKAITISKTTQQLRAALNDNVMAPIMAMQGSTLGFRTDKDHQQGYQVGVVREALIEAVLRGVQPAGNQFNIIAGRCYITKEGFSYLLKNLKGFTDYKPVLGIPDIKTSGALVKCLATWKMNGVKDSVEGIIPIKVNGGMGADAILGKASRKLMSRVYAQATGTEITDGEAEIPVVDIQASVSKPSGQNMFGDDDIEMGGKK